MCNVAVNLRTKFCKFLHIEMLPPNFLIIYWTNLVVLVIIVADPQGNSSSARLAEGMSLKQENHEAI